MSLDWQYTASRQLVRTYAFSTKEQLDALLLSVSKLMHDIDMHIAITPRTYTADYVICADVAIDCENCDEDRMHALAEKVDALFEKTTEDAN